MNNTSKIQIVPAARGGHVPNGWMRRLTPATQYTVLKLSLETRKVLLEPNNGALAIWFDIAAILVPFSVGQILELSEVQS
jgi:hypothetical protein